ncbi:hypothetical protein B0A48_02630 [Cryoendolithus antarcticus]|uniref:Calcineurin-like phosphoesterase domain-containing protein n=1 Tax=Cryoendolithus antarcticus TaxID=1507870 RepID=A0A1V8TL65_9PEZI|nr:hypothetical protein B0A48_02630 [Cryoendolithus antarcticus]
MAISTRFLVISDTHGDPLRHAKLTEAVNVVIHCGDLTEESKLDEFRATIDLLNAIDAPLKLVIAEHDPPLDEDLVRREYGDFGEARSLLEDAPGIVFLNEGMHDFSLANGAMLRVYASPCTPSNNEWGFNYPSSDERAWNITGDIDVAITHCPPKGVMDRVAGVGSVGDATLFAAIARAKPLLHCFGHIHTGWGAKLVAWQANETFGDRKPTHMTAINGDETVVIQSLANLRAADNGEEGESTQSVRNRGYCKADMSADMAGEKTLFVNAAIEGLDDESQQVPWLIDVELPRAN